MNRALFHLIVGLAGVVIGGCLVVFGDGITTPVITLSKVGVVLLVIGALDLAYGAYVAVAKKK